MKRINQNDHEQLFESTAQRIKAYRQDIQRDVLEKNLKNLAETTGFSFKDWCEECVVMAASNLPMPWEDIK